MFRRWWGRYRKLDFCEAEEKNTEERIEQKVAKETKIRKENTEYRIQKREGLPLYSRG